MKRIQAKFYHNWFAILYFNFKMLPFKQAIKLPFDFYFKVRFQDLSGKIILNTKQLKRGIFQWGFAEHENFPREECILSIKGTLIINGEKIVFGSGSTLEIDKGAMLELNDDFIIAPHTKIILQEFIKIGSHVRIGWDTQLIDSNFHYLRNVLTGEIKKRTNPVLIGSFCWIGNHVSINKGTILPDHTIVAANSVCNKDYSKISRYSTLAGIPAKEVANGLERIFESLEPNLINELIIRDTY